MDKKIQNKKKLLAIVLIIVILVIVITAVFIFIKGKNSNIPSNVSNGAVTTTDTTYYTTSSDGIKENNSELVKAGQTVENLVISNVKVVCGKGISKLTADILNKGEDAKGLKLTAKFFGKGAKLIMEKAFEVDEIKSNGTKNISIEIQGDVSNSESITYEIVK